MKTLTHVGEMQVAAEGARSSGQRLGLVPTMGALHEGHLSLVRAARQRADVVVVSIFVNPAQFGPGEDYLRYPRPLEADSELLTREGVDILFAPPVEEIYPEGFQTYITVERVSQPLCGPFRPGHFRGVATVVLKLFNIVQPNAAFFGRKDAQQCMVIERLARDLHLPVEIVACPIVREPDGLAMSSRNAYLSGEDHAAALALYRSLSRAREMLLAGERRADEILKAMRALVEAEPRARVDYIEIVNAETLEPLERIAGRALIALALWIGPARLIDNLLVEESAGQITVQL
ncbi:MAG: pantoate--beta-alanine ligase [Candidatus Acidiferrales bacterium]